ncbi:MAG: hypothetical protein V4489_04185 [Chlamydiota bacterium]
MINRLSTLGDLVIRSATGPTGTGNSKDKNRAAIVGGVTLVVFSTGAYYGLGAISRSLAPKKIVNIQEDANQKWGLPPNIKKTLDKLFEGSSYRSVDDLPFYPVILGPKDSVEREKMKAPIEKGTIGGKRFIVIQLDAEPSDEHFQKNCPMVAEQLIGLQDRKVKSVLFLFQSLPDGPHKGVENGACVWDGGRGDSSLEPKYFEWNFTYSSDGSGPTNSQKGNFERVKNLIKNGAQGDLRDLVWRIPQETDGV